MKRAILFVVAALFGLSACVQPVRDENSGSYWIPVGSVVELHQPLNVPEGYSRVFLQDGQVTTWGGYSRYRASCSFETRTLSDGTLAIRPGHFTVVRVAAGWDEVAERAPRRYAALTLAATEDSGSMGVAYRFHLYFDDASRDNTYRLSCRGTYGSQHEVTYPSIAEIREALGEVATLHLTPN